MFVGPLDVVSNVSISYYLLTIPNDGANLCDF